MDTGLDGLGVLVTGGAGGIGTSIVRAFAGEGAKVAVHYRSSEARAEELAAEVGGVAVGGDLTNESEADALVPTAVAGSLAVRAELRSAEPQCSGDPPTGAAGMWAAGLRQQAGAEAPTGFSGRKGSAAKRLHDSGRCPRCPRPKPDPRERKETAEMSPL